MFGPMAAHEPQELHTEFARALNVGDLEELASLYEDDATIISGGQVVQGIAAIREALGAFLAMSPQMDLQTVSVLQGASNLALLQGRWTWRGTAADGSRVESSGTSREVARRHANGNWLYVLDDPGASN